MGFIEALVFGLFVVIPLASIAKRLGYHPAWSLIAFVPIVNLIALNYIAFARWPFKVIQGES